MTARYEIDQRDANIIAGIIGGALVVLYVAFYFLSTAYYEDRAKGGNFVSPEAIDRVRVAFAYFIASVGAGSALAVRAPRIVGHSLSALAGLGAIVGGVAALNKDLNLVLPIGLFATGVLFVVLTWKSLERSRAGWAFLVAMCAVFAMIMLFGATKIRTHLDVTLYYALMIPGLLVVAMVALVLLRREYRESA